MSRVVSLSDPAYAVLSSLKRGQESFSQVVLRISTEKAPKPVDLRGVFKGVKITEQDIERAKRSLFKGA